ncbi:MAG TPA: NusG domain II-containing protein [Gammaproteobacteria bacterium]|nr:NusG domain II-containing protein [Gammaproteobacteria bacterium]
MTIGDGLVLLGGLLLVIWLGWQTWISGPGGEVIIYVNAERHASWPLEEDRRLQIEGSKGASVIQIENGAVRFVRSPCTNKLCIRSGWLHRAGAAAACLPNHVSLLVTGIENTRQGYDAINF